MSLFGFALLVGLLGLAAMAILGAHGGHAGHHAHVDMHVHAHDGGHDHAHDPAHGGRSLLSFLSPRILFSLAFGFGAAGLLARPLGATVQLVAAIAGAIVFEFALVRPLWNQLSRFAGEPAMTLESCVMDTVDVVTPFDQDGYGMVAVDLDGSIVQVLARLRPEDRQGRRLAPGEQVRVEAVDAARGRCTVARLTS